MIRDDLATAVRLALQALDIDPVSARIELERPARREHGDWSTNVALATAKAAGRNPRELAGALVERLSADPPAHVEAVEIAGPGFVNFRLAPTWLHDVLAEVVEAGLEGYGASDLGAGDRVQLEFVSANPTGPIHVGNGWFASYGDALGRILTRTGHRVSREYYVNDTGGQVRRLGASLLAHRHGEPVPEDGYPGRYVADLAAAYDGLDEVTEAGQWAAERILAGIRSTMESIHIHYDEWYSQASIQESAAVAETVGVLAGKGCITDEDGALWFESGAFGDPRERRVLRKSNGDYTYLAGDIAYHRDKFLVRGFDRVIDVWGADHHGQVASLRAGVAALGVDPDRLEVRLGQMISLTSGKMSKRAGNVVDLDDVVADIGADATRLLSLLTSIDQAVTIDLDKVRAESRDSPVFYVQYANTRIASINRVAAERGVGRAPLTQVDLGLLTHERELDVLRTLSELPDAVRLAATDRAPHKVATWVRELADRFHGFYHDCYVMGDGVSPELTQARLWLVEAARIGFAIALDLLGVSAPESM
ncbi:MAG: arginine--tRNA ligase [Acidimicrobiales bacterium]